MYDNGGFHGSEYLDIVWDLLWTKWQWDSLFSWYFSFPVSAIHVISTDHYTFILRGSGSLSRLLKMKALRSFETWGMNCPVMVCCIPKVEPSITPP